MVKINIGGGQGMTQAIASNLNLSEADKKKIQLSTWQQVMSLVDDGSAKTKDGGSIFGNKHDASKIGNKSGNNTNFLVHEGQQVEIDNSMWNKIVQLLTGKAPANAPKMETLQASASGLEVPKPGLFAKTDSITAPASANKTGSQNTNLPGVARARTPVMVQNTPIGGDVKTGEQVYNSINAMFEPPTANYTDITVTSDEWRQLANKKNKTPEEQAKMQTEYNDSMKKLGSSYSKFLSKKYGDNSGKLDEAAFLKFQNDGNPKDVNAAALESNKIAFKRLDVDGDGKIDEKEMSAFMMALDFGQDGKASGIINEEKYYGDMNNLISPNDNNYLDKKLAYSYKMLYGNDENQ